MTQWLSRGFEITGNKRIKKLIHANAQWQIYLTNTDGFALAVSNQLFDFWSKEYSLPQNIFISLDGMPDYKLFVSTDRYLISSLNEGPFPNNNGQVEAFSMAFSTAQTLFPNAIMCSAIYIEEYSLILPIEDDNISGATNDVVYGKWLTGGIEISINSVNRVAQIMSWLPTQQLYKSIELAGFQIDEKTEKSFKEDEGKVAVQGNNEHSDDKINYDKPFALIGRPELEQFFNENIIDIVSHIEEYKRMGISFPGATILHGPPGCGKTYAIDRLSEYLGWPRFDIDSGTIASPYIHDTSKKISEVFDLAIKTAPSIIVIDEMEAFLTDRNASTGSGTHHVEEVAEFLRKIPEAISNGVLVFAMTNMIDTIDPAILRRGRFDHIIEVKMASKEEIEVLLLTKFKELPVDKSVDVKFLSAQLEGHPMSDIAFVLREAGRIAVKEALKQINSDCFNLAIGSLPTEIQKRRIGFNAK